MAEYIEREALIKKLRIMPIPKQAGSANTWLDNCAAGVNAAIREVASFPAADVAPVVYGRWTEEDWVEMDSDGHLVRTPKAALRCSNCRHCFKKELLWKDNYCPNCGAKMDGGDGDAKSV